MDETNVFGLAKVVVAKAVHQTVIKPLSPEEVNQVLGKPRHASVISLAADLNSREVNEKH